MGGHWYLVSGDPTMARDTVYNALANQGFKITPVDEWTANAERGSAGASIMLGAFAGKKGRHVKLHVSCQSTPDGTTVRLMQGTSGFSGGLIGVSQADTIYSEIYNAVAATFQGAGVLLSGGFL